MRLVRYGAARAEKPAMIDGQGRCRDLSGQVEDIAGDVLLPAGLQKLARISPETLPEIPKPARLGCPIGQIGKIIGVGLNYRDHAAELKLPLPQEPTLFLKASSSLAGPGDDVLIPREAKKLDWEIELGIVIGAAGVYIPESSAMRHVAGYCAGIDFSERDFQFNRGGQGFKGKSADTLGPLGPWLATRDEIPDTADLKLTLSVNGVIRQNGQTRDMVYSVAELVSYISRFMSLQPGDVILSGTPAGVGMGSNSFLQAGDEVVASIEKLGEQRHAVKAA